MRRKENERVRCMKAMISASLYDTCLYFFRMEGARKPEREHTWSKSVDTYCDRWRIGR